MMFESEFIKGLFQNAIFFLDEAISYINRGVSDRRNMILAIINMQISMELALKSSLATNFGLRTILVEKQANLSEKELQRLYEENNLKIKEYDSLKNFLKTPQGNIEAYNFEKPQYKYMERFQKYRNRILHSSYVFSNDEIQQMESDLIYVLIHILGVILSDRTDEEYRTFVQEYLNSREYSKLILCVAAGENREVSEERLFHYSAVASQDELFWRKGFKSANTAREEIGKSPV